MNDDYYNRGLLFRDSKELNLKKQFYGYDTFDITGDENSDRVIITKNGEDVGTVQTEVVPDLHPAFQKRENNSLFHCLTDAADIHLKDEVSILVFFYLCASLSNPRLLSTHILSIAIRIIKQLLLMLEQRVADKKGVSELIGVLTESQLQRKVFTASPESLPDRNPLLETSRKPFIVVEGLDATGKLIS